MICPECGDEFRHGIDRCPDCQVELLEELPEEAEPDAAKLVTVAQCNDLLELQRVRALLEQASIPFAERGDLEQSTWHFSPAFSSLAKPVEIEVPEEEVEAARQLLEGAEAAAKMVEEAEQDRD